MHPLNNGSQATERPAKKPLSGTAGWFTESGENNVPSYPGQDWFNNNIAEFQAAIAEMGVLFDPQNDDHLAKAFRAVNQRLGAKVMGVINVSEIINNSPEFILPITPELGAYVTLAGHGAANFTITGFGDACPVGYTFSLLIPRTIPSTGGAISSLGNYVQFIHSASGDGLDLKINERMSTTGSLYTYQAYPNANDRTGNKASLHEKLEFMHQGNGRWVCTNLPTQSSGTNAVGSWTRDSSGIQSANTLYQGNSTLQALGQVFKSNPDYEVSRPVSFTVFFDSIHPQGNLINCWIGRGAGTADQDYWRFAAFGAVADVNTIRSFFLNSTGRWKPNV